MMTVWLVFKIHDDDAELPQGEPKRTEFLGVFTDKDKAAAQCLDRRCCICPAVLDSAVPWETVEWVGCEWPALDVEPIDA